MANYSSQNYPRIEDETDKFYGFLDESELKQHSKKPTLDILKDEWEMYRERYGDILNKLH